MNATIFATSEQEAVMRSFIVQPDLACLEPSSGIMRLEWRDDAGAIMRLEFYAPDGSKVRWERLGVVDDG